MSNFNRLLKAIPSDRADLTLANIKFFLGDDRNVTPEEMCNEAAKGVRQVKLHGALAKTVIDTDLPTTNISEFLKA